ncbi:MAG: hypothetical protein GW886_05715 [Rhodobacterales bacterium]|nr:hypothetical protein [Rhodobacterales bacterium]
MLRLARVTDTEDSDKLGRIRVSYLGHEDAAESDWVHVVTPMAGDEGGIFFMPEAGDIVVVGALDGDLNRGVVLGALWSGMQKPPADAATERRIVSRTGHAITLSDGDDDGITLEDSHGNRIVMNADGISITTDKDLTIKVGGATTFETTGEATIKGSTINLNP